MTFCRYLVLRFNQKKKKEDDEVFGRDTFLALPWGVLHVTAVPGAGMGGIRCLEVQWP